MAAVLISSASPEAPGAAPRNHGTPVHPATPRKHVAAAEQMTARQVLLTAAAHVLTRTASGRYWRVQVIKGTSWPGGTKTNSYDISLATSYDQYNPRQPGQTAYQITQQLATRPSTPADAAAWRAAGSPTTWHSGTYSIRDKREGWIPSVPWVANLHTSAVASPRKATWTTSDGTVGYVEGDLAGLSAAKLADMPTRPRKLAALLRGYAKRTYCARQPGIPCATVNQLVWSEALYVLGDPVPARVRSATLKVMASLPGVRSLGPAVTDSPATADPGDQRTQSPPRITLWTCQSSSSTTRSARRPVARLPRVVQAQQGGG